MKSEEVSFEEVAADVFDACADLESSIPVRASARGPLWGYVEAGEAARELLEESLLPFLEVMDRYREIGQDEAAGEVLRGIILGLYQVEETGNDILQHVPEWEGMLAGA